MIELVKKYVENRVQLLKLNLIGAIANVAAGMVSSFLLMVMGILVLLMFSISLAFWFSTFFESEIIGFALVGVLYLVFFFLYITLAKNGVETRIKDRIVETALSEYDDLNEDVEDEI